jgi:arabinan endo-1,5-alpha-L-arabinosidase
MPDTYTNPVYPQNFPDPFVLKWCGAYWAYCTGHWRDGRCFGVLFSRDLVEWEEVGGALEPLPGNLPHYWAPEVSIIGGRFFMYYSAGVELEDMAVRVAVADHPAGPFFDAGVRLTNEPFAIDAHVFQDSDGQRYLFYASDYLEHTHVGTGTTVDRLTSPFALAGEPRPVTRARFDWQVYDPQRAEKGGVRWHTIEGSFVLRRKGLYYQMFSGGNWQNISYGVSYATSERVWRPDEWEQHADGEQIVPILRTVPGRVVGPGHNSVVRGPDNRQLFCVYHRWVGDARTMAIDPLDWAGERMLVLGPTDGPSPAPIAPTLADGFEEEYHGGLGPDWQCDGGAWSAGEGEAIQDGAFEPAAALCTVEAACFVAEVSVRALLGAGREPPTGSSAYGIGLDGANGTLLYALIAPAVGHLGVLWQAEGGWREDRLPLPPEFDPSRYHLLRAEVDRRRVRLVLDEGLLSWQGSVAEPLRQVALRTSGHAASFAGFALTAGYEDLFDDPGTTLADLGWKPRRGNWRIAGGALACEAGAMAWKPHAFENCALVVNARALDAAGYALHPLAQSSDIGPTLAIEATAGGWQAIWRSGDHTEQLALPTHFDGNAYQQWRIERRNGRIVVSWEGAMLATFDVLPGPAAIGLAGLGAASFEMVRLTAL